MAALTVWVTYHLMEPAIILHTERLLTVLMDLVEDLAWDGAEDLAEVDEGGKFYD